MHGIYKYVFNNEIVYIGKTDNSFISRFKGHEKEDKFKPYQDAQIYVFDVANSTETTIFEKLLINKYQPKLNVTDTHDSSIQIDFTEPDWIPWENYNKKKKLTNKIKADINFKEKQIQRIKHSITLLESDKNFWDREIWVANLFQSIINNKGKSIKIAIPKKFIMSSISKEEQFTNCFTTIFNTFSWITNSNLRGYDICSLKASHYQHYFVKYDKKSNQYIFYMRYFPELHNCYLREILHYMSYIQHEKLELLKLKIKNLKKDIIDIQNEIKILKGE